MEYIKPLLPNVKKSLSMPSELVIDMSTPLELTAMSNHVLMPFDLLD